MPENIYSLLKTTQMVHLATIDGDEPRLRPMTLIVKDRRFYFATGSTDDKTRQITSNPAVEFCLLEKAEPFTGTLRCRGNMIRIEDVAAKKEVAYHAPFIYEYWKEASDPDFVLYECKPYQFRYMAPGDMKDNVIEV